LPLLLHKHALWIASNGAEGVQLDLAGYDMRGVKLFTSACLSLMKGAKAIFYGVNFQNAQMQAAYLQNADMRYVNAESADMRGIDLTNARLINANFKNARFDPLIAEQKRVVFSHLSGAACRYADFSGASLRQVRLINTDLSYANLLGADLTGADLTGANLTGARLNESQQALIEKMKK